MMNKINENTEFDHFRDLYNEWWLPNGKFKILHSLTPLRIKYIKNNIGLSVNDKSGKIKLLNGLDILDLGCGGGLICEPLARLGANITGVDFVDKNIEVAKKHAKKSGLNINYINQKLSLLSLEKTFDVILMLEVIEHINDWKRIVKKILKYLKPKGRIIFSTINKTLLSRIFAIAIAENILKWIPKKTHQFEKLVKPKDLITFLKKNNMEVVDTTGIIFNPIFNEWTLNKTMKQINYFCSAKKIN